MVNSFGKDIFLRYNIDSSVYVKQSLLQIVFVRGLQFIQTQ